MEKPGFLSKISMIIGILSYLVADLFTLVFVQEYFARPETFEEGLGRIIAVAFVFIYATGFALLGSFFVILGKVWRQSKILVLLSTFAFLFYLLSIVVLTLANVSNPSSDTTISLLLVWTIVITILGLHFKGYGNASN